MENTSLPVLLGLNLPSTFTFGSAATLDIGASARDPDGQGMASVEIYLDRDYAYRYFQRINYVRGHSDKITLPLADGYGSGTSPVSTTVHVPLDEATASGTYRVRKVVVTDLAGNRAVYAAAELDAMGFNTAIEVGGGIVDTAAPVLLGLDMGAHVEVKEGRSFPELQVRVQDNAQGAGVHEVRVRFDSALGDGYFYGDTIVLRPEDLTRGGQAIDLANHLYPVGPQTLPGTYRIAELSIVDFAGNRTSYTREQLDALGMNTSLTVHNDNVQSIPVSQTFAGEALLVDLGSDDWTASADNSFRLVLGYSADALRFEGAALVSQAGVSLSAAVSGDEWVELTVSGAGLTAAEAMAGIRIALRPREGVQSVWQLSEFSVNGQDQMLTELSPSGSFLRGGEGLDTAVVGSARDTATIVRSADGVNVLDASDRTTAVTGVERLAFGEDYVALDTDGVAGQAYRLYRAAVDRAPDAEGLGYWIHQMDHGVPLGEVAAAFMAGSEFRKLYGSELSDAGFIAAMYDNVLHRAPDEAGLAWWRAAFADGLARETALVYFSESAENIAQVAPDIANGIDYTLW